MSYENPRIKLGDKLTDMVIALAEGNPGALNVISQIIVRGGDIDPDDFVGALGALLSLDTLDIYGSNIWRLYKDVSDQNLNTMLGLMRAVQLGYLNETTLMIAIREGRMAQPDIDGYLSKVKERLPNFCLE